MAGKPLLYIHAGHPKCGSTTVRSLLSHHAGLLAANGIFLLGDRFEIRPDNGISDWPLWFVENAGKESPGYLAGRLAAAHASAAHLPIRALVLSAENLSDPATAARLDGIYDRFDVRLLYYMRRQDHFLAASWRQWALKRGTSFEIHVQRRLAEGKPDFTGTLAFWESRIGRDAIHARFVDPRFLRDGDLGRDVFAAMWIDVPVTAEKIEGNTSPDRAILLFLQENHWLFRDVHDDGPINLLSSLDSGPTVRMAMDRPMQERVIATCEPANQEILRRYGAAGQQGVPVILPDATMEQGDYGLTDRDRQRLDMIFARLTERSTGRQG